MDNPFPVTIYKIEVIKNIKNQLSKNIELYKEGGLRKDAKAIITNEDSTLFNINDINLFYGIAQEDGVLFAIGKDKYVQLDLHYNENDKSKLCEELENNEKYLNAIEAFSNEKVFIRKRNIANDDITNNSNLI